MCAQHLTPTKIFWSVGTIIIPILQFQKLRFVETIVCGYVITKQPGLEFEPRSMT